LANISTITILGNIGRDPETRFTPNGKMNVSFTVAVNKRRGNGEEAVLWFRVTAWGKLAEILDGLVAQGAMTKGKQVYVAGDLDVKDYQSRDGETRTSLDVFADKVQLLGARPGDETPLNPEPAPF
jgi:single-strand DNA-binding protein